jgi:glycopeptide antibiotics resistance protein
MTAVDVPVDGEKHAVARVYALSGVAFTAFAIWGSLFPFDVHPVPPRVVWALLWADWGAWDWSLTDLVSNVLLFLPIALSFSAAAERAWPRRRGLGAAAVFAALVALSASLEAGQAFVPTRQPSVVDIAAEAVGALSGIVLWRLMRVEIDAVVSAAVAAVVGATRIERALMAYGVLFAGLWLVPADFTLRPNEIADKYVHKRLLLPLMPSPDASTPGELAATAVAAIPLGAAFTLCGCAPGTRRSAPLGALAAAVSLIGLEVAQVSVFSRTTDATALLTAIAGAACGAGAARLAGRRTIEGTAGPLARWVAVAAISVAAGALVEWWPLHVASDARAVQLQMALWSRAPFRLPAQPYDMLPGVALAAAAGWLLRTGVVGRRARIRMMLLVAVCGVVFAVFEVGRVLLVSRQPTLLAVAVKTAVFALVCGGSTAAPHGNESP